MKIIKTKTKYYGPQNYFNSIESFYRLLFA